MKKRRRVLQPKERPQWLFVVKSRAGFSVRTTAGYWSLIATVKHPTLLGKEEAVIRTLVEPDEVRMSRVDESVHLFYRKTGHRFLCVVAKRVGTSAGFIMTAYITDSIKEGRAIWKK